jgi:ABC-type oligopeptide transport system substrate-binding subunit
VATTGVLLLALTPAVQAQQRSPIDIFNENRAREREEAERRREMDRVMENNRRPTITDQRQRSALILQIKEDFNIIQLTYNEMVRLASTDRGLDYESFSEKAADIMKRATRFRANINVSQLKDEKKIQKNQNAVDGEQLKASLLMLGHSISRFVNNPLFQNLGAIDIKLSDKASRDLRDIIELSGSIRKTAKRLNKAHR